MYERYLERLGRTAGREQWSLVRLQDKLSKTPETIFIDYCHFSFRGSQIIAELIAEKISALELIN